MGYIARQVEIREHREVLLNLWKTNLSDPKIAEYSCERFDWLYGDQSCTRASTFLGLLEETGEVIGCGSFFRRPCYVGGGLITAGVLCDFAVEQAHRTAGPAVAIQRAVVQNGLRQDLECIFGYPNRKSAPIFKRLGYEAVGKASILVKPLRSAREVRKRVSSPLVSGIAAGAIDLGLSAADMVRKAGAQASGSGSSPLREETLESADARFDVLWQRARDKYRVITEKSAEYLNWRYRDFPTSQYRFFCLADRSGESIKAYLVYRLNANNAAEIADLFAEDHDATVKTLMLRFASALRKERRDSIRASYVGPESFTQTLKSIGFLERPCDRSLVVQVNKDVPAAMAALLKDPASWLIFDGELDI